MVKNVCLKEIVSITQATDASHSRMIFWITKSLIFVIFLDQCTTISEYYSNMLAAYLFPIKQSPRNSWNVLVYRYKVSFSLTTMLILTLHNWCFKPSKNWAERLYDTLLTAYTIPDQIFFLFNPLKFHCQYSGKKTTVLN